MDNMITVPDMPYMREIFKILRNGDFINEDCRDTSEQRYYRSITDNYDAYFKYFSQLGYYLNRGNGYSYLSESRLGQATHSKLRTDIGLYLPMLHVLMKFRPELEPGYQFKIHELQRFFDENDELRSILPASDDGLLSSRVAAFIRSVAKEGFINVGADETTCMVTSAYRYLKEYVLRIRLYGEHSKFNFDGDNKFEEKVETEETDVPQTQGTIINETEE